MAQRQKTASELNRAILAGELQDTTPRLHSLLKLLHWVSLCTHAAPALVCRVFARAICGQSLLCGGGVCVCRGGSSGGVGTCCGMHTPPCGRGLTSYACVCATHGVQSQDLLGAQPGGTSLPRLNLGGQTA